MNEHNEHDASDSRSSVEFTRTAKGVITPKVKIYSGDITPNDLDLVLLQAKRIFEEALIYAEQRGEEV